MKKALLLFIACLVSVGAFASGGFGTYTIEGTMLDKHTRKPLPNIKFVINKDTVTTDSWGKFIYKMQWATACPIMEDWAKLRKQNERINPPIAIIYHNKIKMVKNKWKEYFNKEETYKVKLYW